MKPFWRLIVFAGLIIFSLTSTIGSNVIAGEVITLAQYEVLPYMGKDLPGGGPFIQYIKSLFESMGHEVKIEWFPHKRAYVNIKKGLWDCSVGWNKLPERDGEVLFSDTILYETIYLYHLKSTAVEWNTIEDLKGHRIGIKLGAGVYGDDFLKAGKEKRINLDYALTDLQNLKKLFAKRIDIVPLSKINAGYLLRKNFSQEEASRITCHPKPILKKSFHLIFSLENKQLMTAFNTAFLAAGGQELFTGKIHRLHKSVYKKQ